MGTSGMKTCLFAVFLMTVASAEATFDDVDHDHNGLIDHTEFAFANLDQNHDGVITFDEFTELTSPTGDNPNGLAGKPASKSAPKGKGGGYKDDSKPAKTSDIKSGKPSSITGGFAAGMAYLKKSGKKIGSKVNEDMKALKMEAMKVFQAARDAVKAKKGGKPTDKGTSVKTGKSAEEENEFVEDDEFVEDAPKKVTDHGCASLKASIGRTVVSEAYTLVGGIHETVLLKVGNVAVLMEYGAPHSLFCTKVAWSGPPVDSSGKETGKATTVYGNGVSRIGCVASGRQSLAVVSGGSAGSTCGWWTFNSMTRKGNMYGVNKRRSAGQTFGALVDNAIAYENRQAGYSLLYNNCQHLASLVFDRATKSGGGTGYLKRGSLPLMFCAPLGFRLPGMMPLDECW